MVPAVEWSFWMDESNAPRVSDFARRNFQNSRRVFGPIANDVIQFEAGSELAPGVTAVAAPGHTPGHTAFFVSSGNAKLMLLSDTTNHPALFVRNPDWQAVFDMDGDLACRTRHKLLDMAAEERAKVVLYHAPFPATGHIARHGQGYEFVPIEWTPAI
jgi:glyoxylase-like metal-dependent hydrolase (beta-lactamase superfamily II)